MSIQDDYFDLVDYLEKNDHSENQIYLEMFNEIWTKFCHNERLLDNYRIKNRLYDVISNADENKGTSFPHWFPNGWFVLIRKNKAVLCHSSTYDSRYGKFSNIMEGRRNDITTYTQFATAMNINL